MAQVRGGAASLSETSKILRIVFAALCQLICNALPKAKHSRRPKGKDRIYIYRILYGEYEREHIPSDQADSPHWLLHRTNRLLVSTIPHVLDNVGIKYARFLDCVERLVDLDDDSEGYIVSVGNKEKDKDNFLLHGRALAPQFDFNLAKRWIDICANSHGDVCSLHSSSEEMQRPLRVINIEERRVEDAPSVYTYAALSYRWPDRSLWLTLGANTRKGLTESGGLADDQEDIPLSIRDAMIVCSQLSIPYLWVDALCIMQDDNVELNGQMGAFADIYKGAHLTITAASASEAGAGLPGARYLSRAAQPKSPRTLKNARQTQPTFTAFKKPSSTVWQAVRVRRMATGYTVA
jgi:hypothetical protein